MTTETIETIFDNFEKTVLETCDIWDTDYSSDNWETEFMTIFGTWQLIVTLDSFAILAMFCKWCVLQITNQYQHLILFAEKFQETAWVSQAHFFPFISFQTGGKILVEPFDSSFSGFYFFFFFSNWLTKVFQEVLADLKRAAGVLLVE